MRLIEINKCIDVYYACPETNQKGASMLKTTSAGALFLFEFTMLSGFTLLAYAMEDHYGDILILAWGVHLGYRLLRGEKTTFEAKIEVAEL